MTTSKTASEQASAPRRMIGRNWSRAWENAGLARETGTYKHEGEHDLLSDCLDVDCTPIEQASASVGLEPHHPLGQAIIEYAETFEHGQDVIARATAWVKVARVYDAQAAAQARQIAVLQRDLCQYGRHIDGCRRAATNGMPCTCGILDKVKAARAALEEPQGE